MTRRIGLMFHTCIHTGTTSTMSSHPPEVERPQTLELPRTTPTRSAMMLSSYGQQTSRNSANWSASSGSGGGTPTNPNPNKVATPEDSVSSDLDVFVPARSDSGFVSTNRIRFSPSPFEKVPGGAYVTDWSPTHPNAPPEPLVRVGSSRGRESRYNEKDIKRDFHYYQH